MRLFKSGKVFCGERELSDLGLKRLLTAVIGDDIKSLCTFFCEAPDESERTQRKAFINGVDKSKDQQEFLQAVQSGAHNLSKIKHLYSGDYKSDMLYWFRYVQNYIEAIHTLATINFDDESTHSERFCMLVSEIRRENESMAFQTLCEALQATLSVLREWQSATMWYQVTEGAFSTTAWLPDTKEKAFSERTSERVCRLFGNTAVESCRSLSLSDTDEYLRQVCAKHTPISQSFESLADTAKRYRYIDFQSLSQDICIVWNLLALLTFLRERDVPLCDAAVGTNESFSITSGMDISLLDRVQDIVPNDFYENNHISLLHGANSGGKTAFMRMVGICTAFAMWGLPVPAKQMSCPIIEMIRTVFTMTESLSRGRLMAEKDSLDTATQAMSANTLLLVNEVFSSTNETDAAELSKNALDEIYESDAWCVWNTHHILLPYLTELPYTAYTPIVDEQGNRSYVIQTQAHTSSKATDIAARYRLRREQITARLHERHLL